MVRQKKVMILGAAGRVGMQICAELLRLQYDVVLVDVVAEQLLRQKAGRLLNDSQLAIGNITSDISVHGEVDALDQPALEALLAREQPNLIINYAIPITWDAAKRLPNYSRISAAGLGAFTPIQVLTPLAVARAIDAAGIEAQFMVGNLPDITVPVITGIASNGGIRRPSCGAGNVGLNQVAFRRQLALECGFAFSDIELSLVSHHVHWVAPREPGYSNEAPFMAQVRCNGEDVTAEVSDLRAVMNRGVVNYYEPDAAFSSTTGILASRVAVALLDDSGQPHFLHAPAPNGLPGGYPLCIQDGEVALDLPATWQQADAIAAMEQSHTLDGVQSIAEDGTVTFTGYARDILREETGFELPTVMSPGEIEDVAREQIEIMNRKFAALGAS